jgi:hypothetical protein
MTHRKQSLVGGWGVPIFKIEGGASESFERLDELLVELSS